MLTRLRQVYGGLDYLWFLEFQARGAPHIHILLSLAEPSPGERQWLADLWAGIVCDGHDWAYSSIRFYRGRLRKHYDLTEYSAVRWAHLQPDVWEALRARDGAARYVVTYATKPHQKRVPGAYSDVGRFWGASRSVNMGDYELVTGSEGQIRDYLSWRGRDMGGFDLLPQFIFVGH